MKFLLAVALMATFSMANLPGSFLENNQFEFGSPIKLALTSQIQNGESKPPSAVESRQQERAAVGSPTRVWRYVIIGSAIVILALIGVIAAFRLKRYIAGRHTSGL